MADKLDIRIGRNLSEIRLAAGLDRDALAGRSGLPPDILSAFEAGRVRIPIEVLVRMAEILDRPIGDFFA